MRFRNALMAAATAFAGAALAAPLDDFDACAVLTQPEAEKVLGTTMAPEPANPKVKRPKVVTSCAYHGFKDGKPVDAKVQFRFGKADAEVQRAFDEEKLKTATKPLLLSGADSAFWSAKTGLMHVRKGKTWAVLQVGPAKPQDREFDPNRALAEILAKKL